MKRILISFAIPLYLLIMLATPQSAVAPLMPIQELKQEKADMRVLKLQKYLESHKSPLAPYSAVFVKKADEYQLDWKLVPAISGVESTFGKAIPYNSYNAYGWANGNYAFANWEESIDVVSKTLKTKYIDRGADTVEEIAYIYAPPSKTWAGNVRFFMNKIDAFTVSEPEFSL